MITKDMFIDLLGTMPGGTRSEHAEALRLAEDPSWGYDEVWRWAFNSGWYVFRRRGVAEECFGMLRAIGAPPEYALIYRSTTSSEDAVVCFKSGVPAAYAVGMRGWGINTRIRFFEAGSPHRVRPVPRAAHGRGSPDSHSGQCPGDLRGVGHRRPRRRGAHPGAVAVGRPSGVRADAA